MENRHALNEFFAGEEQKAFRVARYSVRSDDDALDVIQDAMLGFVSSYAGKPEEQWRPLFYKILYSRLTDYHRRLNFRRGIMRFFTGNEDKHDTGINLLPAEDVDPQQMLQMENAVEHLQHALKELPLRQQQAVLMRAWQGFDTAETARIMQLSPGSVKTHYSRGLSKLKQLLGDEWP